MAEHREFPPEQVHLPYSFEYADAAARAAATGLVLGDEGKFARQLDNNSIWMLTDFTGPTWVAVGSSGSAGTKTLMRWTGQDVQAPSSAYANFGALNAIAVYEFDPTTPQSVVFVGIVPEGADFTTGIKVRFVWAAKTATSGDTIWTSAFEKSIGVDLNSDHFATGVDSAAQTAPGTAGQTVLAEIDHDGTEIDGIAAGDFFRLKLTRKAGAGGDNMTGLAQLFVVEIRQR